MIKTFLRNCLRVYNNHSAFPWLSNKAIMMWIGNRKSCTLWNSNMHWRTCSKKPWPHEHSKRFSYSSLSDMRSELYSLTISRYFVSKKIQKVIVDYVMFNESGATKNLCEILCHLLKLNKKWSTDFPPLVQNFVESCSHLSLRFYSTTSLCLWKKCTKVQVSRDVLSIFGDFIKICTYQLQKTCI